MNIVLESEKDAKYDEDKKKWLVTRIDLILDGILEQTKQQEAEFEIERTKIIQAQREIQKTLLILLGIGISIIVGYNQTEFDKIFSGIAIFWFPVIMMILFICTVLNDFYLSIFLNRLRKSYKFQTGNIAHIKGDFLQATTEIDDFTSEQFQTYALFCWVASASAQVMTLKAYEKTFHSRQCYRSLKKHSEERISQIKHVLKLGTSVYDKRIDEFRNEELLKNIIAFLKPLESYKTEKTIQKKS